ncbi:MAG: transketolase [Patescibacteria group bacterium]
MKDVKDLIKKAAQIRLDTLIAMSKAGKGCTGSCMSVLEILTSLYYGELALRPLMNFDSQKPGWDGQDYMVLSKGHAAPTLYSILADLGFFDKSELDYFGQKGSMLSLKPNSKIPGVCASISSHGSGLSVAVGMALALKMDKLQNKVFAVLGDGELQEGQVWEAAMSASHYKLNNLIAVVDNNGVQSNNLLSGVMNVAPIQEKFEAFGWQVIKVLDGHDFEELFSAFERAFTVIRKPVCIWCKTVSGKGVDFAEGKPNYQGVTLSSGELESVISKLKNLV